MLSTNDEKMCQLGMTVTIGTLSNRDVAMPFLVLRVKERVISFKLSQFICGRVWVRDVRVHKKSLRFSSQALNLHQLFAMLLFTRVTVAILLARLLNTGLLSSRGNRLRNNGLNGSRLVLHLLGDVFTNPWPVEVDDQRL